MRVGIGYDVHCLAEGRKLILGGVEIPHPQGLLGHSDADVLCHAVMDALLGAAGLGDIGMHFPDREDCYKDISSMLLLERVRELLEKRGYVLNNLDCIVIGEAPRLAPYREIMRDNLARHLQTDIGRVNIKATTTEGLGFTGRKEGIAAQAVCTLIKQSK